MMIVTLWDIRNLKLPLDNTDKILERGSSEEELRKLEKKYGYKTKEICYKSETCRLFWIYVNEEYKNIPSEDKHKWLINYEIFVRSSFTYKFLICFHKLKNKLKA